MNCRSLLVMVVCGMPYLHIISFQMNCWTCWAVMVANGLASIHLVKYLMTTIRNFTWPFPEEKGPRMSFPHFAKGHGDSIEWSCSCF